mgnify:CR=1 FL=1
MARTSIHPGEILAEELEELGVSPTELSRQIRVPANRISQIINGKRAITGDTALRLAHWFGTSPQFWMNLQALFDVRLAEQQAVEALDAVEALAAAVEDCGQSHDGNALGQALDKFVGIGIASGHLDFVPTGLGLATSNIFGDGEVE